MQLKLRMLPLMWCCAVSLMGQTVRMGIVKEKIPTYKIGNPEVDPIFFTGRVYQGAEGYIYPYPLYDVLTEEKEDKEYELLRLDNEYVSIGVLPEIGGRIFQATDRTNNYHFFYTQTGIKPALIGMLGAWLSGGVEWNIPDHHRASSYMPVDWKMEEHADGSKTIWVGETELRHRLKWSVGITVYPNRSWVEAKVKVINPTPMIQSMLYWANVSVHCNERYQVIFPPDVQVGVDHHKVYFTPWPEGPITPSNKTNVDLSWWKNFTESVRYIFAWDSKMNFLAGYDYGQDAGTVHVANRHQVPGKKFFLWGNNPSGQMWNKILSDNDGHYLELMVGAYSDNQPDYSWINPGEIREFSQIWYPIKGIKGVKNATEEAAVNFQPIGNETYRVGYQTTTNHENARVMVKYKDRILMDKRIGISPDRYFLDEVAVPADTDPQELYTALYDKDGKVLVDYRPVKLEEKELPKVIDGTKPVKEYETVEELYLAGLRVDQFNNARLSYMDFYREALRRDSMDARVNIEVGKHHIRQGEWEKAEKHLLRALDRLTHDYTRAMNTEANYYLGYLYRLTGRTMEAEENLWAATYTPAFKHPAFYQLAVAAVRAQHYPEALKLIDESLLVGAHDLQALTVKAYILRRLGKKEEAAEVIRTIRSIDPLDYMSEFEESFLDKGDASFFSVTRKNRSEGLIAVQELLEVAANYITLGDTQAVRIMLDEAVKIGAPYANYPLIHLYMAYTLLDENKSEAMAEIERASMLPAYNNFPLRIEELPVFEALIRLRPDDPYLHYYYGNLLYYLGQKDKGLGEWYRSAELNPGFALACRNVGFAEGQRGNMNASMKYYDRAIEDNPRDPLLMTESDKIYEKAGISSTIRLKRMEKNLQTVMKHDDAVMRLLSLYNETGNYAKAIKIMDARHFHLWEGGGEIHVIYVNSHLLNGMTFLKKRNYRRAIEEFALAMQYPANLEVARSSRGGYEAKAYYLTGVAYEGLNEPDLAREAYEKSAAVKAAATSDLAYYQIKSLRKLGQSSEADAALSRMVQVRADMQKNLMDSYAKFGEADRNVQQSNLNYFGGLIELLQGNDSAARTDFSQALKGYPGNIWAKWMSREEAF